MEDRHWQLPHSAMSHPYTYVYKTIYTILTSNSEVVCFVSSCAKAHHSCFTPHDHPRCSHLQSGSEVSINEGAAINTNIDERSIKWASIHASWKAISCDERSSWSNEGAAPFQRKWSKHSTGESHQVSRTCELPLFTRSQFHILYNERKMIKWT